MRSPARTTKLVALDIDGTLLGAEGAVSERTRQALAAAQDAGLEVVIATGRRHCYAMRVLRGLGLREASAVVSSNGAVIRTIGSELLHRRTMPVHTARWVCGHVAEFRNTLVMTFDKVGPDGEDMRGALVVEQVDDLHASVGAWMRANEAYIQHVSAMEEALTDEAPIQMMLCGPAERMRRAEARLLEHEGVSAAGVTPLERVHGAQVALHRTEYPERDLSIVDILPAGCSKGSALLWLAEHRGLGAEDILAVGDNWNDVSMLDVAGRACLMANAPEELLAMAEDRGWEVVPGNLADGVAVALEGLLAAATAEV